MVITHLHSFKLTTDVQAENTAVCETNVQVQRLSGRGALFFGVTMLSCHR